MPLVRLAGLDVGASILNGCNYLDPEMVAKKWSHFALQEGDILLSTSASLGRVAVVGSDGIGAIAYTGLIRMRPRDRRVFAPFIRYLLASSDFQHQIEAAGVGSVIKHFGPMHLKRMSVNLPSPEEQRAIAHILGAFDDKIELNRRMNGTLEAIARALFKSWFVSFDPVRAKMNGEPPESICQRLGLTPELLALFPDRLVVSKLGEIPEGWEVKQLDQLTNYLGRGISPKYIDDGGILVLNQKCVRDSHVDTSKGRRHDPTQRGVDDRDIKIGDILVNSTGVGTLGRVAQILVIDEPTIVDSHVTVVRADAQKVSWNYLGVVLLERQAEIEALGEGSTGQTELSRTRLGALSVLMPPIALRNHFDECVLDLRRKTSAINVQNIGLADARDALLPKLLTGELRVPVTGDT
ncbi:MAG: restriction endonuclease subunit S [Sideroxydans sp.]|nr:restriction endonuclease subunit S [Sideroxydans sp.]